MLGGSSSSSAPLAPDVSAEADGHPSMLGLLAAQDSVSEVNPVSRAPGAAVLTRAQAISVHVPEHLLSRPAKRKKGTDVPDAVGDEPRAFPERAGAHFREPASLAALRYRRFDEAWSRTESRIKAAVAKTHAATLARIASFLATEAPATPNPALPTLLITVRSPAPSSYLPPVLDAINGVAVTATLLPKDAKDLKSALASVSRALATSSSKFLKLDSAEEEDEDDNVYFRVKKAKGAAKIPEFDPAWIVAWWRTLSTECGKREVSTPTPTILLPSLPSHAPGALTGLIHTLHSLRTLYNVPLRLIVFSTNPDLSELLPFRSIKLLEVSRERMSGGIEPVWSGFLGVPLVGVHANNAEEGCETDLGFEMSVGRRVMAFLAGRAADWEGGGHGVTAGIKLATMSHYYAEPVSIFCLPPGSISSLADQLDPILKQIEAAGAEAQYAALFAELAATGLARFVANAEERFPPAEDGPIIKLLELAANWPQFTNTPANFRQLVTDVLSALQTIRTELHESWNTLALFASNTNLKLTSEGWLMLLEERLVGSPWWNRLWAEVRNWEREKWDEFLRKFAGREGKFGEKAHELKSRLDEFPSEKQFKPRLASLQEKRNTARSRIAREHDAERAMHSDGTIDGWRDEACVWMEREVKAGLKSPSSVPFAELWCFDNVALLEKHLCPPIRACLHTALGNPSSSYLACNCCPDDRLRSTMNDTSIAYRLYLEHGRMVNLADWAVQFRDVVMGGDEKPEEKEDEQSAKEIHARFIRSASELQFLGLVKPTNRKKDHVLKVMM